ncbi:MAG: hypothetical protein RMA76_18785 [Deltaproteobacteria bacterium]
MTRIETVGTDRYRFVTDALPTGSAAVQAILTTRIVDEVTGRQPATPLRLSTLTPDVAPRLGPDGLIGLVAQPLRRFGDLAAAGAPLHLRVEASGYIGRELTATLGPIPGYPAVFNAVDLGVRLLHRAPVRISGIVVRRLPVGDIPVVGASVRVTEIWLDEPSTTGAPLVPNLITLHQPLARDRSVGAQVRPRGFAPNPVADKRLVEDAEIGEERIDLENAVGVVVGEPLVFEPGHPDREEVVTVAAIEGVGPVAGPQTVRLDHPLVHVHREGTVARPAARLAPGVPTRMVTREVHSGDATLFLDAVAGVGAGQWIEVFGGAAAPEFRRASLFSATTSMRGRYALPPISRVARLTIRFSGGSLPGPLNIVTTPAYGRAEQRVDVVSR